LGPLGRRTGSRGALPFDVDDNRRERSPLRKLHPFNPPPNRHAYRLRRCGSDFDGHYVASALVDRSEQFAQALDTIAPFHIFATPVMALRPTGLVFAYERFVVPGRADFSMVNRSAFPRVGSASLSSSRWSDRAPALALHSRRPPGEGVRGPRLILWTSQAAPGDP